MEACRNAFGLAIYQSPSFCVLDYTGKGLDDYALAMGRGVRAGIAAALQAEAGYRCSTFAPTVGHAIRVDLDALGERFCIDRLYFKPFPACRSVHGPAEAAMTLRQEHDFAPGDIASVCIELAGQAMYTARPIDMDTVDRITSAANPRYVTACGLVDGEIRLDRFREVGMRDPDVFALVARTTVIENSEFTELHGVDGRPTRLTLTLQDGRTLAKEVRHAYGAPANPMTDDDLGRKLVRYAGTSLTELQAQRIIETVFNLGNLDTIELMARLRYAAR
jgi:2-methylcitrate dehydratase PrpD